MKIARNGHERLVAHLRKVHEANGPKPLPQVAADMGLSRTSKGRISSILNGKALPVDAEQTRLLVRALGGSPADAAQAEVLLPLARTAFRIARAANSRPAIPRARWDPTRSVVLAAAAGPDGSAKVTWSGPGTLWDALRAGTDRERINQTVELVDRIRRCDPDGTTHAERLVTLVGWLLGPHLADLTSAEAVLLVLAAHHHGLDRNADRINAYLHQLPAALLTWGPTTLLAPVEGLCRSTRMPIAGFRGPAFDPQPGLTADLRFCAVVLRIAELLELSDTRPPQAVRQHLHLTSDANESGRPMTEPHGAFRLGGLSFPAKRAIGYRVTPLARPDHPSAEHHLRTYLAEAEAQMLQCQSVQHQFQARWQGVALPGRLPLDQIQPDGYKYGDFRFELDRAAILELFMGEQLYDDPQAFLRELLQNAFDAIRLRQLLHGVDPADTVDVSCWQDAAGYLWVRVDDPGTGMDEHTLLNYFLRVGRSYYRSPELKAELVRRGPTADRFTPISRFGIGVLSCFMVADLVEVSTRRVYPDGSLALPLRLSLRREQDYFVLREAYMPAGPMPARIPETADEYRAACGTSIAVRLDPLRSRLTETQVAEAVDRFVFCPPVSVLHNGKRVGRVSAELVDQPWLPEPQVLDVATSSMAKGRLHFHRETLDYQGPLRLALVPLDLTGYSVTPMLRGQLLSAYDVTAQPDGGQSPDQLPTELRDLLIGLPLVAGFPVMAREALRRCVTSWSARLAWTKGEDGGPVLQVTIGRGLDHRQAERARRLLKLSLATDWIRPATWFRRIRRLLDRPDPRVVSAADVLRALESVRHQEDNTRNATSRTKRIFKRKQALFNIPETSLLVPWSEWTLTGRPDGRNWPLDGPWLGHNGIALPQELSAKSRLGTVRRSLEIGGSELIGVVALSDALRPDVSISRDQGRGLTFAIHSALQLAVSRAVKPLRDRGMGPIADRLARQGLVYDGLPDWQRGAAVDDELVRDGSWDREPVFSPALLIVDGVALDSHTIRSERRTAAQSGQPALSVQAIRQLLADGALVRLAALSGREPKTYWSSSTPETFHESLRAVLLATRLELAMVQQEGTDSRHLRRSPTVVSGDRPDRPAGVELFPPLTFLPFHGPNIEAWDPAGVWNLDHPLVRWVVVRAPLLARDLPTVFDQIRELLAAGCRKSGVASGPTSNETRLWTSRLRELADMVGRWRPELAPPPPEELADATEPMDGTAAGHDPPQTGWYL